MPAVSRIALPIESSGAKVLQQYSRATLTGGQNAHCARMAVLPWLGACPVSPCSARSAPSWLDAGSSWELRTKELFFFVARQEQDQEAPHLLGSAPPPLSSMRPWHECVFQGEAWVEPGWMIVLALGPMMVMMCFSGGSLGGAWVEPGREPGGQTH